VPLRPSVGRNVSTLEPTAVDGRFFILGRKENGPFIDMFLALKPLVFALFLVSAYYFLSRSTHRQSPQKTLNADC
jgi:hypothetical protein